MDIEVKERIAPLELRVAELETKVNQLRDEIDYFLIIDPEALKNRISRIRSEAELGDRTASR